MTLFDREDVGVVGLAFLALTLATAFNLLQPRPPTHITGGTLEEYVPPPVPERGDRGERGEPGPVGPPGQLSERELAMLEEIRYLAREVKIKVDSIRVELDEQQRLLDHGRDHHR